MNYTIEYHEHVVEDLAKLSIPDKSRIKAAIESKLLTRPELFGKPLRKSLRAYRGLRVGKYRIIYRIQKRSVLVFVIASRSIVYGEALKRQ